MVSVKFLAGAAVGYVLGTKAGREQYEKIMARVKNGRGGELLDKGREAVDGVLNSNSDEASGQSSSMSGDGQYTSARL